MTTDGRPYRPDTEGDIRRYPGCLPDDPAAREAERCAAHSGIEGPADIEGAAERVSDYLIDLAGMAYARDDVLDMTEQGELRQSDLRLLAAIARRAAGMPEADAYSRDDFGPAEAWGWNACRDYLLGDGEPS